MFAARQSTGALDRLRVRVDQELVRVEPVAVLGRPGAVDAIAVALAGPDARQVAVPVERRALDERDAVSFALVVEQAELDVRRRSPRTARSSSLAVPRRRRAGTACRARPSLASSSRGLSPRSRRRASAFPRRRSALSLDLASARRAAVYAAARAACGSDRERPGARGGRASSAERLRSCGSGHAPRRRTLVKAANSRLRPSRVASAIAGSMWSVKNWNGLGSPYSSPMKSSGVCAEKSTTDEATRSSSGGSRSPRARLPTWSWFCAQTTWRSGRPARELARRHRRPSRSSS